MDTLPGPAAPPLRHRQRLREEFQPRTPTAEILTDEVARHAVALQRAEQIETAVMRQGARAASLLFEHVPLDADREEAMLAGAAASAAGNGLPIPAAAVTTSSRAAMTAMRLETLN